MSPEKCSHFTRSGAPCQAWAVRGSSPPRCPAHGGQPAQAPAAPAGAEADIIAGIIADLAAKQQRLSVYIDGLLGAAAGRPDPPFVPSHVVSPEHREGAARDPTLVPTAGREGVPLRELAHLLALHSQNAARLGRLLRDKRALSGEAAEGLSSAIDQALDELATEWGIDL
jgi:hypothetical protein